MQTQLKADAPSAEGSSAAALPTMQLHDYITIDDTRSIASKIENIWVDVATKLGIKIETVGDTRGMMNTEGSAEAVLVEWLERSKRMKKDPPTWKELYDIVFAIDSKIADNVDKLR
ncbi:uncharacterized protein LOC144452572 [Glandiceps talaboti]